MSFRELFFLERPNLQERLFSNIRFGAFFFDAFMSENVPCIEIFCFVPTKDLEADRGEWRIWILDELALRQRDSYLAMISRMMKMH